jgi:hypothetical protein
MQEDRSGLQESRRPHLTIPARQSINVSVYLHSLSGAGSREPAGQTDKLLRLTTGAAASHVYSNASIEAKARLMAGWGVHCRRFLWLRSLPASQAAAGGGDGNGKERR